MNTRVVITGMGVISPIGNSLETFWQALRAGRSGLDTISRFDPSRLEATVAAEVKAFDPLDFMDSKAAKRMALFSQYAVSAAVQAWNDAGFAENPPPDMERVSVICGNGIGGNELDLDAHQRMFKGSPRRIPPLTIPKIIINEAPGNISMMFGITGRVHAIVTACASGTDAIGTALDLVRSGRAEVVVTGGTESAITEYAIGGFCQLKALSTGFNDCPARASRPFDAARDGFVMGEGAGMLILESLDHARARGASIYAELAGYGASGDAYHLTAPRPDGGGAARAMSLALQDAGLEPQHIDYINAHGTSTPVNDPIEIRAIKLAFGDQARKLKVSSTKSMTGHCMGAAGALEAIATAMALHDGFIPATINLEQPDPECDLDCVPNQGIETTVTAALSNSLGFGGHNGVLAFRRFAE